MGFAGGLGDQGTPGWIRGAPGDRLRGWGGVAASETPHGVSPWASLQWSMLWMGATWPASRLAVVRPAGTSERRSGIPDDPTATVPNNFSSDSFETESAGSLDEII